MGAWGFGIRQDDFVCDVIDCVESHLKAGKSIADATKTVQKKFAAAIDDVDEGPLFWIALADVQWSYGKLEAHVKKRVKDDFKSGRSLTQWTDDPRGLARRKTALAKFIEKISVPNPRARKAPKVVVRPPKFRPGDCLSICLSNGQYGAGIVLGTDHSDVEYGMDFVVLLDYLAPEKPAFDVFHARKWLHLTHHNCDNVLARGWHIHVGFQKMKPRLEVIGTVNVLDSDPKPVKEGVGYSGWLNIGEQVIWQREWDAQNK